MVKNTKKKKEATLVDQVFQKQKRISGALRFKQNRFRLFFSAIFSGLILIFAFYLFSDFSKIKGVQINGNYYITDKEIMKIVGIDKNTRSLFLFEGLIQRFGQKHPLIQDLSLMELADGSVKIDVIEKQPVGYRYVTKPQILTSNGELIEMDKELEFLILQVPLIVGFESEDDLSLKMLAKALASIDPNKIEFISEVHQYSYSYDGNGIRCVMRDGNEVFGSFYSILVINEYNQIASVLPSERVCIFIDEMSLNPYTSFCPDEQTPLEAENAIQENPEATPDS